MDFFNNAVVKAREAIDIACKKTNKVVEAQKYRFDISALQSKLSKDFESLGKLYFEKIKDTDVEDADMKILVDEINIKNQKIKDLNTELNSNLNKKLCPNCNTYIENNSLFCNNCGAKLNDNGEE